MTGVSWAVDLGTSTSCALQEVKVEVVAQKTGFSQRNYCVYTFTKWLSLHTPDQLIVQAIAESPNGLTRRELRERFPSLSYETFLDLL